MSDGASEGRIQSLIRLEAVRKGIKLWRNNVGALVDRTGRMVRFGLANDSKALNEVVKSGDLIGWETIIITPDMVGQHIARFVSVELKAEDWKPGQDREREEAQKRWADTVNAAGGRALIVNREGML